MRVTKQQLLRGNKMGTCGCGYTTDEEKNCNGTHKVVAAVKADIAAALEAKGQTEASEYVKTFKKNHHLFLHTSNLIF